MALTSFMNCDQDFAGDCFFCSTRSIACVEAVWMSPWCGPITCGRSRIAEVPKILPTGALLKNGFLKFVTTALLSRAGWLGRLPVCLKTNVCEEGEVRNLTRS